MHISHQTQPAPTQKSFASIFKAEFRSSLVCSSVVYFRILVGVSLFPTVIRENTVEIGGREIVVAVVFDAVVSVGCVHLWQSALRGAGRHLFLFSLSAFVIAVDFRCCMQLISAQ
jgi:hypothetical protein